MIANAVPAMAARTAPVGSNMLAMRSKNDGCSTAAAGGCCCPGLCESAESVGAGGAGAGAGAGVGAAAAGI